MVDNTPSTEHNGPPCLKFSFYRLCWRSNSWIHSQRIQQNDECRTHTRTEAERTHYHKIINLTLTIRVHIRYDELQFIILRSHFVPPGLL